MNSRRQFIASAPLGLAGILSACNVASESEGEPLLIQSGAAQQVGVPRPLVNVPANAEVLNYIPKHAELTYTFGGVPAVRHIRSGTRIVTWTEDCFDGAVKTTADLPSKVMKPGHDNPQTGPFYIEGAEPGDTVSVQIIKLTPARDYGIASFLPGFGAIVGTDQTAVLGDLSFGETTWRFDLNAARDVARTKTRDGQLSWEVPLRPFLGCLGVAPALNEARSTIVPGPFGGNMDCPEVRPGNTVFLGVNAPGAMLSFGDGHYSMGEGEIMGTAIEGAMNVEVYVELIKKSATPVPRIENTDEVMFVGSGRPLEDAARMAYKAMISWARAKTGMAEADAYQFVSQNTRAMIIQLVDPEYTVLVGMQKSRLPRR
jgi:acetamidase/formamidase